MQSIIKEVGRGKKGARDLTREEALTAAERVVDRTATDAQIGAFFMAERMKGESVEELRAFVDVLRARTARRSTGEGRWLDCAGPYDGRAKSFAATIPVAAVLAANGVPVLLHGIDTLPPKNGVSLKEIVLRAGRPTATSTEELERGEIVFADTEALCPPLRDLRAIRLDLGVRTLLNTAEKFLNPARAEYAIAGVFHTSALEKASELMAHLGYRRAMIVQGIDGSEDVPVNRPSAFYLIEDGKVGEKQLVDPREYDLRDESEQAELTVEEQAQHVVGVLNGQRPKYRNMVIFNSALRLWLAERAESIAHGVELAATALDSGRAWEKFEEWK